MLKLEEFSNSDSKGHQTGHLTQKTRPPPLTSFSPTSSLSFRGRAAALTGKLPFHSDAELVSSHLDLEDWEIDKEGLDDPKPVLRVFSYPDLPEKGELFRVQIKHLRTPNERAVVGRVWRKL
ncbi:hypothetical protein J4Q44_G00146880 [Coregonus suidteri]|uniref:Uncharacterized protein n=1 Tax=Coregonus suidteri TaxID=861788 RepID=A0AAN8LS88_9TELE